MTLNNRDIFLCHLQKRIEIFLLDFFLKNPSATKQNPRVVTNSRQKQLVKDRSLCGVRKRYRHGFPEQRDSQCLEASWVVDTVGVASGTRRGPHSGVPHPIPQAGIMLTAR